MKNTSKQKMKNKIPLIGNNTNPMPIPRTQKYQSFWQSRVFKEIAVKFIPSTLLIFASSKYHQWFEVTRPRKYLRLEQSITMHCNLNCKSCGVFCSLAKEQYINVDQFEKDLTKISELTGRQLMELRLMGGEPLLHPQIIRLMKLPQKYFEGCEVNIVTNGILLTKMVDEFWMTAHNENIQIQISHYPIKLDTETISKKSKEFGVNIRFTVPKKDSWFQGNIDLEGKQNAFWQFKHCSAANQCMTIWDGKLYPCTKTLHWNSINEFFHLNLPLTKDDYIDLHKISNKQEVFSFLSQPVAFCKHCMQQAQHRIDWDVSKKEFSEWCT